VASFNWLKSRPDCSGKVGAVGFCFGGGIVNRLAVALPDLAAGVPFYGRPTTNADDIAKIKAPLLLNYAENDQGTNANLPAYEAGLKANNKTYQLHIYPGAQHGFHNDTTPRYDEAAAKLAWTRTLEWFNKYLR
jgi:carboxymethylenebutenolidase